MPVDELIIGHRCIRKSFRLFDYEDIFFRTVINSARFNLNNSINIFWLVRKHIHTSNAMNSMSVFQFSIENVIIE